MTLPRLPARPRLPGYALLLLLAAGLAACTQTRPVYRGDLADPARLGGLDTLAAKQRAVVELRDGRTLAGRLRLSPETLAVRVRASGGRAWRPIPVDSVRRVTFRDRDAGTMTGLTFGAVVGFLAGNVVGLAQGDDPDRLVATGPGIYEVREGVSAGDKALVIGAVGGFLGALACAPFGDALVYDFAVGDSLAWGDNPAERAVGGPVSTDEGGAPGPALYYPVSPGD